MPDLITLARAKQAMPTPPAADDAIIEDLIDAASEIIELYCRRTFASTTYDEIVSGRSDGRLRLKQFPIVTVTRVAASNGTALQVVNENATLNQRATVRITSTGLVLGRIASGVTSTDSSILWSGHATVQSVANAVTALGNGWKGTVVTGYASWPPTDLRPLGVALPCLTTPAELVIHDEEVSSCRIDVDAGFVFGEFPEGDGNLRVEYTAGYTTVPEAVQQACAMLVAQWYAEGKHDAARRFDALGEMQVARFIPEGLPEAVRRLLAPWRNLMA
jgi:hypothetical protein